MFSRTLTISSLALAGVLASAPASAFFGANDLSAISDVAESVAPAVVSITTKAKAEVPNFGAGGLPDFFNLPPGHRGMGRGAPPLIGGEASGVIISPDGLIVTNHHVVRNTTQVRVHLADDRELDATVVGSDEASDVALVKVDAKNLPYLKWGDAKVLRLGEVVLAVGNPFGVGQTVTMGIVSAKGRNRMGIVDYEDFIQTDAAINPGNSGGALVNMKGELVGINTAILSRSGGTQGVGFAVPSTMAQPILEQLRTHGKVRRGWLGVSIQDLSPELAQKLDVKAERGVLLGDILNGGPAEKAKLESGDVVTAIDGRPVKDANQLRNMVALGAPGTKVKLSVERGGGNKEITLTLEERPANPRERNAAEGGGEPDGSPTSRAGATLQPLTPELRAQLQVPSRFDKGVVVAEVEPESKAARAGLRPGDVIVGLDKRPVRGAEEVEQALGADKPVLLRVLRDGNTMFLVSRP